MANYSSEKNMELNLDDFLKFYYDACVDENKVAIVWSNLMAHHYKNDLTKHDISKETPFDAKALPRYLLASN